MPENRKPYPAYKDSGVPWLGQVPQHWRLERTKRLCAYRKEINSQLMCGNVLSLTLRGVVNNDPDDPEGLVPKDYGTYQFFGRGDLVFKLIDLENLRTSRVGLVQEDGIMSPAYVRLVPRGTVIARFLYHQFFDLYQRGVYNQLGAGVRSTLGPSDLLQLPILLPTSEEQTAIVRYLDHADRKVRHAIRAWQRLIKLLTEQKQAIIQRAVTRGLDPNARLKPSGVPWLGDVPERWNTPLNQQVFREVIRPYSGVPEVQLSLSQQDGLIATSAMRERSLQTASHDNWKVAIPGDLVLNRFKAHLGVFFAATLRGIVSFHYGVFAPKRALNTRYFEMLFHTSPYRTIYAGSSNGMTVGLQNLSNQNFYDVRCVFPPVSEQDAITQYVDAATANLDKAIDATRREIDLLREYRTRLIADVVTGKLDVRDTSAHLPDEPEEQPEPLDEEPADDVPDLGSEEEGNDEQAES